MIFKGEGVVELAEENIFKKISEYDIFSYYIPNFKALNKVFLSPLRQDNNPSCSIQEYQGKLFYKDFGSNDNFTAIAFVMAKFNVKYYEALSIISADFGLGLHSKTIEASSMGYIGLANVPQKKAPKVIKLRIKRRKWNSTIDKKYWGECGISKKTLSYFNVVPISHLWINFNCFKIKNTSPSYAYIEDKGIYKILSPYSQYKWVTNCNSSYIQGWNQLPEKGELLIITKSKKDVMLLYEYNYNSIAPQSENTTINLDKMMELKNRFTRIIVFFDNDEPGLSAGEIYEALYEIDMIHIPITGPKDISDYRKKYGDIKAKQLLKELLL